MDYSAHVLFRVNCLRLLTGELTWDVTVYALVFDAFSKFSWAPVEWAWLPVKLVMTVTTCHRLFDCFSLCQVVLVTPMSPRSTYFISYCTACRAFEFLYGMDRWFSNILPNLGKLTYVRTYVCTYVLFVDYCFSIPSITFTNFFYNAPWLWNFMC